MLLYDVMDTLNRISSTYKSDEKRLSEINQRLMKTDQKTPLLAALLDDVQAFCKARRGRVVELAAVLGVAQSQCSAWLSRKFEPSGEVTLRIQAWLASEREAEKAELAARIEAAPARLAAALRGVAR